MRTCTHFLTHIPQPIHRNSEINAILSEDLTSMQSFPEIRDRQSRPWHICNQRTHSYDRT
ncbi:hypothetical protein EDD18DRAFT_1074639 [Armillaria luteobubalina]|uniref:Uncharacterized protein n=1 Tax=Armillaria luteobubalina TaxID=153913 RepID=A0AA39UNP5_9AGAR|nr:hypothetical protein EDD18DRAFT_1074639 [Armillaria luteobubalina]